MDFDDGAVHRYRFDLDAHNLSMLQAFKDPIEHPGFRPAAHACIDGVPAPEALGHGTPFAPLLGDVQNRVEHLEVGHTDVAALAWQAVLDEFVLGFGNLHADSISHRSHSVNRP